MNKLVAAGMLSADDTKKKTLKVPALNIVTEEIEAKWFVRSCYQVAHEKQWERYWETIASNEDTPLDVAVNLFGQD